MKQNRKDYPVGRDQREADGQLKLPLASVGMHTHQENAYSTSWRQMREDCKQDLFGSMHVSDYECIAAQAKC